MAQYCVTLQVAELHPPHRMSPLHGLHDRSTTVWVKGGVTYANLWIDAGAPDDAAARALHDVTNADPDYRPRLTRVACRRCSLRLAEEFLATEPAADRFWEALARLLLSTWQRMQAERAQQQDADDRVRP